MILPLLLKVLIAITSLSTSRSSKRESYYWIM
jgi:hypothetical protein